MKDDFYLTLPSHSSLQEFPNNVNNNFKVRLPRPLRLTGDWKVALASISVPDPRTAFPSWLNSDEPLLYASWFSAASSNHLSKKKLLASFRLSDINDHVDMNMMSGLDFMIAMLDWFRKKRVEEDMRPNREFGREWINNNVSTHYTYYPKFKAVDNDIVLDCSDVEFHDFGRNLSGVDGWKSPAILLNKRLAIKMRWFENDPSETNPQFAVKLGSNLVMELRGDTLPSSSEIKTKFNQNGDLAASQYKKAYWLIPRNPNGSLSNYIRLSLDVNWRFVNLNYAFKHVFGPSMRSLSVYSDVGGSSVLGDQLTDFIHEVNYKREGKGTHYFEPTHMQYIPLRKELLDIIQIQVAEGSGALTEFGDGVTTVTFHFKKI